jgi:sugar/nucleoside kinase (ribokinase family)
MNGVLLNDDEIMLLCGSSNLIKCSTMVLDWGAEFVIVKIGEHGAIFSTRETIFPSPAYPLDEVVDPTGAGDSFAGGFMGYIARKGAIDEKTFKKAVVYGNVMGSFVVEAFGVNRLLSLTMKDIEKRFQKYTNLVRF